MLKNRIYSQDELAVALKCNDINAFEYFYDRYAAALYGVILRIVHDEQATDLLFQESFLEVYENIRNHDSGKCTIFTWALSIFKRKAMDYHQLVLA
ncbi:RNA polymerase sigma factor [Dyadobacter sp. NIV53]|uniref:RNA polymerase sigma factor n=1 Tax=Dyadobacter sp. NIV53 TaxID=2861765 RepID=UPI001C8789F4|nr:sigma factor [Dyadobacter sp. NIV53]